MLATLNYYSMSSSRGSLQRHNTGSWMFDETVLRNKQGALDGSEGVYFHGVFSLIRNICTLKKSKFLKPQWVQRIAVWQAHKTSPSNLYKMIKQKSLSDNHNECDWFNLNCAEKSNRCHGITPSIATSEIWTRSYTWTIILTAFYYKYTSKR